MTKTHNWKDLSPKESLYGDMLFIRKTEELILELFSKGKVSGTTHTCIGQEANSVGVIGQLDPVKDFVISNHRCHGHFLAFGGSAEKLLAEIMGREGGVCGGYGGSQHLKDGNFFSNGILGGGIATGCGIALGEKLGGGKGIVAICCGDGTLGEGILYESLNMAALWSLPVLFLVENNLYAQTTPINLAVSGSVEKRAEPFGIESSCLNSTDIEEISAWASQAINKVRERQTPFWAVIETYRFSAHSKGDDTRPLEEIEEHKQNDPILIQKERLTQKEQERVHALVDGLLVESIHVAEQSAFPENLPKLL